MIVLLRVIRAYVGLVFLYQIISFIPPALALLLKTSTPGDGFWMIFVFKLLFIAFCGWLFVWLKDKIHGLNFKKHGVPHPALLKSKWAL